MQCHPSPCLLKPPPLLGSLKVLDDNLHIDSTHASIASLVTKSKVPKSSDSGHLIINKPTAATHTLQGGHSSTTSSDASNQASAAAAAPQPQPTPQAPVEGTFQRSASCKKPPRPGSTKRKKSKTKSESDTCDVVVLNNGRERSQISRSDQHILQTVNRIQNDTKEEAAGGVYPKQSLAQRRMSSTSGGSLQNRRASLANAQLYMNLGRRSSKNINSPISMSRRMSSIEQAYEKVSNINIYNFEQPAQVKTDDKTKLDIGALQQSLSNINIPTTPRRTSVLNEYYEMQVQSPTPPMSKIRVLLDRITPHQFIEEREDYSLYIFPETNK